MRIEKRTMNWLPRPSLYAEAEAARQKRRAQAQADLESNASLNASLIAGGMSTTGEAVNLTLRIAAARIRSGTTKKI